MKVITFTKSHNERQRELPGVLCLEKYCSPKKALPVFLFTEVFFSQAST